jgi:ABC-2 type transporter
MLFNRLILMMDGYITYQGPARDSTLHFSKIGFVCPGQTNPADYYMRILSINYPKTKADDEKIEKI